jgi:hypothetical protein
MSLSSLSSLALARLPATEFSYLREEDYLLPEEYLSGDVWKQRAIREFRVSAEYFDLPVTLGRNKVNPEYRYLEIKAKHGPTEEMAAHYLEGKHLVSGIYESLAGVYESLRHNDEKMVLFFAERLPERTLEDLRIEIASGKIAYKLPNKNTFTFVLRFRTSALRTLAQYLFPRGHIQVLEKAGLYPTTWQMLAEDIASGKTKFNKETIKKTGYQKEILLYLISIGNREAHMRVHSKVRVKTHRNKEEDIVKDLQGKIRVQDFVLASLCSGRVDFFEICKDAGFIDEDLVNAPKILMELKEIPLFLQDVDYEPSYNFYKIKLGYDVVASIIYGGNPRILLYMKAFANDDFYADRDLLFTGYYLNKKPQNYFSSITALGFSIRGNYIPTDVDIVSFSTKKEGYPGIVSTLRQSKGILPIFYEFKGRENYVGSREYVLYPLSQLILRTLQLKYAGYQT